MKPPYDPLGLHSVRILDKDGNVVRWSRNLRAIMEELRVSRSPVRVVSIDRFNPSPGYPDGYNGKLTILWCNGHSVETNFASYDVCVQWVRNRRNLKGTPLSLCGGPADNI